MSKLSELCRAKSWAKSAGRTHRRYMWFLAALAVSVSSLTAGAAATGLKPQVFAVSPVLSAQVLSLLNKADRDFGAAAPEPVPADVQITAALPEGLSTLRPARKPLSAGQANGELVNRELALALDQEASARDTAAAGVRAKVKPDGNGPDPNAASTTSGSGEQIPSMDQLEKVYSSEARDFANQSAVLSPAHGADAGSGEVGTEAGFVAGPGDEPIGDGARFAALRPPELGGEKPHGGGHQGSLWERNAVPVSVPPGAPVVAIVLDDLGLNRRGTWRAIDLPAPMTLAFMTYANGLGEMVSEAQRNGHELILHFPMEPRGRGFNPGPKALRVGLDEGELSARLDWGLSRFKGLVGVNNHMGSRFTAWAPGMDVVMRKLKRHGLLFLDSVTTGSSVGSDIAARHQVPHARRDIFLDNDFKNIASIRRQLARTEALARRRGFAVAIGHPHATTLKAIEQWYPGATARGVYLVPISEIVRRQMRPQRDIAALPEKSG